MPRVRMLRLRLRIASALALVLLLSSLPWGPHAEAAAHAAERSPRGTGSDQDQRLETAQGGAVGMRGRGRVVRSSQDPAKGALCGEGCRQQKENVIPDALPRASLTEAGDPSRSSIHPAQGAVPVPRARRRMVLEPEEEGPGSTAGFSGVADAAGLVDAGATSAQAPAKRIQSAPKTRPQAAPSRGVGHPVPVKRIKPPVVPREMARDAIPVLSAYTRPMQCDAGCGPQCTRLDDGSFQLSSYKEQHGVMHSPSEYFYGWFSVRMQLHQGYSGGINFAFYLIDTTTGSNTDPEHAEIDLEFYGARTPGRILMATNVFAGGMQNLAEHYVPFDSTASFNDYSIAWSNTSIIWFANGTPFRVLNRRDGSPWPRRPMRPMFSVWDTSGWTRLKADYSKGPVSGLYRDFQAEGCEAGALSQELGCSLHPPADAKWTQPLSVAQLADLLHIKRSKQIKEWGWDIAK